MNRFRLPLLTIAALIAILGFAFTGCLYGDGPNEAGSEPAPATGDDDSGDDDSGDDDTGDDDTGDDDDDSGPDGVGVRAIHISPDTGAVDVYVNGEGDAVFTDVAFEAGTDFAALDAGTYAFNVTPTGSPVGDAVLNVEDKAVEEGAAYTVVVFDLLASIQGLYLTENYEPLAEFEARLRPIHVAAGIDPVDVWLSPAEGDPYKISDNLSLGDDGSYATVTIGGGTNVVAIDTDEDETPDLFFDVPAMVGDGGVANVFIVSEDAATIYLLFQNDASVVERVDRND